MIRIGLAGWGDHDELYRGRVAARGKLAEYARHFPVVEADSTFYAIPAESTVEKWVRETPDSFGFVVKAHQAMTGHARGGRPGSLGDPDETFAPFLAALAPMREAGKLAAVLMQYPPWFDCTRDNVERLRRAKARLGDVAAALEFRHRSWFADDVRERTLAFLRSEDWIHTACDEPQAGPGSIPIVEAAAGGGCVLVRFHGRNAAGWNGGGRADWRDVRYLYRYSDEELLEWKERLQRLERRCGEVLVVFNNNSGGDAAANAKRMMDLLGIASRGMPPEQLDLFES